MTALASFTVLALIASLAFSLGVLSGRFPNRYRGQRVVAVLVTVGACWVVAELIAR
jgi:hypothetical protein